MSSRHERESLDRDSTIQITSTTAGVRRQPPPDGPTSSKPYKRPKLKLACQQCRDRKVRCDGGRPLCGACSRKGYGLDRCVFVELEILTRRHPSQSHKEKAIEVPTKRDHDPTISSSSSFSAPGLQQLLSVAADPFFHPRHEDQRNAGPIRGPVESPLEHSTIGRRTDVSGSDTSQLGWSNTSPYAEKIPSMPTSTRQDCSSSANSPVLGRSSAVGFMKELYQTLEHNTPSKTPSSDGHGLGNHTFPGDSSWFTEIGTPAIWRQSALSGEYQVPTRPLADLLLSKYFEISHWELPIFRKPMFLQHFDLLYTSNIHSNGQLEMPDLLRADKDRSSRLFHCSLNIIFAIGMEYVIEDRKEDALIELQESFFARADRILSMEAFLKPSLQLVQAFILMTRYLQRKGLSERCWTVVGMAIRAAQALGLQAENAVESQGQREERIRTWWACVILDRVQSMTYGRQMTLNSTTSYVLPQMVDDEYLTTNPIEPDSQQPEGILPKVGFFVFAIKLSETTVELASQLHSNAGLPNRMCGSDHSRLMEFDTKLGLLEQSLPAYLRGVESSLEETDFFARQASLMRCRLLYSRIKLFQRTLMSYAHETDNQVRVPKTTLEQHFIKGCVFSSLMAVKELLVLIKARLGSSYLPPPWYTTFYLYTSGTILILLCRVPTLYNALDLETQNTLEQTWEQCVESLRVYGALGVAFAQDCIDTMERVRVSKYTSGENTPGEQGHAFSEDYRGQQQLSHDQNNALLYDLEVAQNSSAVNGQTEGTGLNDLWWANWNNLPGLDQFDMNNQTYDFG